MSQLDEEVGFLSNDTPKQDADIFKLLTKEEILRINQKEPKWRKIRISLLVFFALIWVGLLAAAIAIVVMAPKCPVKPKLEFYEKKVGYWMDVMAFSDSDEDGVGDFQGAVDQIEYIKSLGAGYVIIEPVNKGAWTNSGQFIGLNDDLETVDPALGGEEDFKKFIRGMRKQGLEVVMSVNYCAVTKSSPQAKYIGGAKSPYDTSTGMMSLDFSNNSTLSYIHNVTEKWLNLGPAGIMLKDFPLYAGNEQERMKLLQKFRESVDKINYENGYTKFLFVESGMDSGMKSLEYLGKDKADMAISKVLLSSGDMYANYRSIHNNGTNRGTFLTTGTSSDGIKSDPMALAFSFLLPGSPLVYYSSELNNNKVNSGASLPATMYPGTKKCINSNPTCISAHLPMPWTKEGSQRKIDKITTWVSYIKDFGIENSVVDAQALGRNIEYFNLVKKLSIVRNLHSGVFGELENIYTSNTDQSQAVAFSRKAGKGHNSLIVAMLKNHDPITIQVAPICNFSNYTSMIVFPENPNIPEGESFNAENVYLTNKGTETSIYVFKCDEPAP